MGKIDTIMQPKQFVLGEIFDNSEYVVPIYQRSYAWEKDEIEQLMNDIHDSDSNSSYYIGSLIVDEVFPNVFSVVDGQQRLTTIFLLLVYLNSKSKKDKLFPISSKSLSFEAREKSNRTLTYIYDYKGIAKDDSYSGEINKGYSIIEEFFNNKNEGYKESFVKNMSNIFIIRTQVPKQIDLNHYFEVMNSRGEQLEIHEIAKGKILGVIEKGKPEYRKVAGLIWDKCSQMDSYVQMNFDINARGELFSENWECFRCNSIDDVKNKISIKEDTQETKFSLLDKLKDKIKLDDKANESEENERFESIISFPNFLLIVNEAMQNNQNNQNENDTTLDDKKFIETLEKNWKDDNAALKFIFNLLKYRYLFDKYIIKREFAKGYKEEGKWSLQRLYMYKDNSEQKKPQYKLTYSKGDEDSDKKTETLRSLQSALRITYTSPKTMHWISKALSALYEDENADLIRLLEGYACSKIEKADYKKATGFGIDRIVFTYLDYILDRDSFPDSKVPNFQFQFRNSIEHFHPRNSDNNDIWDSQSYDNFGNLALITVSANSKFSNQPPQSKITYEKIINQSPKLVLMKTIMKKNNDEWTKDLAFTHGKKMLELLEKEINSKLSEDN